MTKIAGSGSLPKFHGSATLLKRAVKVKVKRRLKEDPKHFVLSYAMVFINKQVKKVPYGTKSARSSDTKRSNRNNF